MVLPDEELRGAGDLEPSKHMVFLKEQRGAKETHALCFIARTAGCGGETAPFHSLGKLCAQDRSPSTEPRMWLRRRRGSSSESDGGWQEASLGVVAVCGGVCGVTVSAELAGSDSQGQVPFGECDYVLQCSCGQPHRCLSDHACHTGSKWQLALLGNRVQI